MRKITLVACIGALSLLCAADFSKKSDKELIQIAGSVSINDMPDYIIETTKRAENKILKEAREFRDAIQAQERKVLDKLSEEEKRKRAIDICKALKGKLETMTNKQIRESGLEFVMDMDCERPHNFKCGDHKNRPPRGEPREPRMMDGMDKPPHDKGDRPLHEPRDNGNKPPKDQKESKNTKEKDIIR